MDQRRDELGALLIAVREPLHWIVSPLGQAEAVQPAQRAGARSPPAQTAEPAQVGQLVENPHLRVEAPLLGHVAELEALRRPDGPAPPPDRSPVGPLDAENDPHRSRLACAVGAEETEDGSGWNREGQPVQRYRLAVAARQTGKLEGPAPGSGRAGTQFPRNVHRTYLARRPVTRLPGHR